MVVRYRRPTTTYGGPPATAPGPLPPPRVTWPNPNRHRGYARRSSEQLHINTPRKISSEAGNEWRVTTTQTRLAPTSGVCSHSHFGEASRPFRDGARVSTVCPRPRRCVGKPERSHSATGGSDRCVTWVRWRDHDTGWFAPSLPCGARIKSYRGSLPCTRCWLPCARTTRPVFGWIRGVSCSARPWIELRAKNTLDGFHHSDASYQAVYPTRDELRARVPLVCRDAHLG